MRALALAIVLITGCRSVEPEPMIPIRPSRAAFSYLPGWSRAADDEMVPFSPIPSLLADATPGRRPQVIGLEIRAGELPLVRLDDPASMDERFALTLEPFRERPPHATEGWRRVARLAALPMSEVRIGNWVGSWTGGALQPTAPLRCGRKGSVLAHAEGPSRIVQTGRTRALEYVIVEGRFDGGDCSIRTLSVSVVTAKEILPDLLYGFRTCKGDCDASAALALVFPHAARVVTSRPSQEPRSGFTRTNLPLRRGEAESAMASIEPRDLAAWTESLLPGAHVGQALPATSLYLNVEVTQAEDDPEPRAMAYVAATN